MNKSRQSLRILKTTYSAMFLTIALVLPFLTGQLPQIGSMLSPMHIPVFLCGFLCGWPWGLAVGFIAPLLRSMLFGMPALFPTAIAMCFELAVYGLVSGLLYARLERSLRNTYLCLIAAMLAGRLVWGLAEYVLLAVSGGQFTLAMFLAGAFTRAIPGIILHLVIIPPLVRLAERSGIALNRAKNS